MKIAFPYEDIPPVGVLDANVMAVVGPRDQTLSATADRLIRDALEHPLGSPRLGELARRRRHVLILFDDNTRPTLVWSAKTPSGTVVCKNPSFPCPVLRKNLVRPR
jgi:nickel-dependent lactate racemase